MAMETTIHVNRRFILSRAMLGLEIFHHLIGVGIDSPPSLTRLLSHVETCSKRGSKEREKHDETTSVMFLGQVKGQVTRGHQWPNIAFFGHFSTNSHIPRKLEALQRRKTTHSVALLRLNVLSRNVIRFNLHPDGEEGS